MIKLKVPWEGTYLFKIWFSLSYALNSSFPQTYQQYCRTVSLPVFLARKLLKICEKGYMLWRSCFFHEMYAFAMQVCIDISSPPLDKKK